MTALPAIFVISLQRSPERRAAIKSVLDGLQLPFSFFDAVDGRLLNRATLPDYDGLRRRLFYGRDLTPGELGCLLSHRGVFRAVAEQDIPHALILEDDARIAPDFPAVLEALMNLQRPWDIVRFIARKKVARLGRSVEKLFGPYELTRPFGTPGGAYCTLINLKAARALDVHMRRNWIPNDILLGQTWRTGLEVFAVRPSPVAAEMEAQSTIGDERFDKSIEVRGFEKIAYPFTRAGYKVYEAVWKHAADLQARFRE